MSDGFFLGGVILLCSCHFSFPTTVDSVEFREHFSERNIPVVAHICFYEISIQYNNTISYNHSIINKRAFILYAFTTERKVNKYFF